MNKKTPLAAGSFYLGAHAHGWRFIWHMVCNSARSEKSQTGEQNEREPNTGRLDYVLQYR